VSERQHPRLLVPSEGGVRPTTPSLLSHLAHHRPELGHFCGIERIADAVPLAMAGENPFNIEPGNGVHAVSEGVPGVPRLFGCYIEFRAAMIPEQGIPVNRKRPSTWYATWPLVWPGMWIDMTPSSTV
jgi:hypothetical protein